MLLSAASLLHLQKIRHFSPSLGGQPIRRWLCERPKPVGRREVVGFQLLSVAMHCGFRNVLVVIQGRHLIARFLQFQESIGEPVGNEIQHALKQENPSLFSKTRSRVLFFFHFLFNLKSYLQCHSSHVRTRKAFSQTLQWYKSP